MRPPCDERRTLPWHFAQKRFEQRRHLKNACSFFGLPSMHVRPQEGHANDFDSISFAHSGHEVSPETARAQLGQAFAKQRWQETTFPTSSAERARQKGQYALEPGAPPSHAVQVRKPSW
jgi:hypothetical protein